MNVSKLRVNLYSAKYVSSVFRKMCVFNWRLKMLRLRAGSRRLSGSEFQVDGPATAKHRRPWLSSRYRGTIIVRWLADRRCWRLTTSAVCVQLSANHLNLNPEKTKLLRSDSRHSLLKLWVCRPAQFGTDTVKASAHVRLLVVLELSCHLIWALRNMSQSLVWPAFPSQANSSCPEVIGCGVSSNTRPCICDFSRWLL